MKKKYILHGRICSIICAVLVCMAGCEKSDNYRLMEASKEKVLPIYEAEDIESAVSGLKTLEDVYRSGYVCEEWVIEGVGNPGGILCTEDEIIISDRKNNCILKTDYEGNIIKKTGEAGSGEGEFLSPGAIAGYEDDFYIIDQGNQRIQVLDKELYYVGEIKLKDTKHSDPDYRPGTLAVSEDGVYVAGFSLEDPVIDRYERETGECGSEKDVYKGESAQAVGENFIGSVAVNGDKVYAVNSAIRYYDKESDGFGAASNGPEWLFAVEGNKFSRCCELPDGFGITAFVVNDNGIVGCSTSAGGVFALNTDGEYEETIAYMPGLNEEEFPQISENRQEYYIALPQKGKIFRCFKE